MERKNRIIEQYSADRKRLLREKKRKALKAAGAAADGEGDEVEEEEEDDYFLLLFPEQTINEEPEIDHNKMNNKTVRQQGNDNWLEPYWYDKWHPREEDPATVSDACPFKYVEVTDALVQLDKHMVKDELKTKRMRESDCDITLFSDRGAERAQLIVYRRRCAYLNSRTADSLRMLRVIMGKKLIGFLIWNKYESARCIPYWVLTATVRGNGCLQKNPANNRWSSHRFCPDDQLPPHIIEFRDARNMIDLSKLMFWGMYGIDLSYGINRIAPHLHSYAIYIL